MLQKFLRSLALFTFLALIFSPLYYKPMLHYFKGINLEGITINNHIDLFFKDSTSDVIKLQSDNNVIQVVHFTSSCCQACSDEDEVWQEFNKEITHRQNFDKKLQLIHIILSEDLNYSEKAEKLLNSLNYKTAQDANIQIMLGVIKSWNDLYNSTNIESLPYTFIIKDNRIVHTYVGALDLHNKNNLLNILTLNH
jgi:hypothetical protein